MAETGSQFTAPLLTACRQGAAAAAAALGAAFEAEFSVSPPESVRPHDAARPEPAWRGPGLVFTVSVAGGAATILLPNAEGLIPAWCAEPDADGEGRLLALARELAAQLLPRHLAPAEFHARWGDDLSASIGQPPPRQSAVVTSLPVTAGSRRGILSLIIPVIALRPAQAGPDSPAPAAPKERLIYERIEEAIPYLPVYSRSLLKIKVPVRVTLASTKLPVRKIVELSPGTLIQFSKLCEEPLDLEVGQRPVARGEAVKIGEKFGLRVTSIIMPGERFVTLAREG